MNHFNYENYGCEFLDLDKKKEYRHPRPLNCIYLPMNLIQKLVDPRYQLSISGSERVRFLQNDIYLHGLKEPGTILISPFNLKLQDGNHRSIACRNLQYKEFPVKLEFIENPIKQGGVKFSDIIEELFYVQMASI